jgi:peroxiredoxin
MTFIAATALLLMCFSIVKAQGIDLRKYKLIFNGKEISLSQMDSLVKLYPSFTFQKEESTTPPTIIVIPETREHLDRMKVKEDSVAASWMGRSLPSFSTHDINGIKISSDNLKGKIVVINLYFTHCTPCLGEIPELNKLVQENKGKNVVFIALAPDKKGDVLSFLKKHPFKYTQISDADELQKTNFQVQSWPTHIIVDANGIIRYYNQGYKETTISEMKATLSDLLK